MSSFSTSTISDNNLSTPMGAPMTLPHDKGEVTAATSSPTYYRNYEMYTSSPFHIPNSQAPIPGKEVYWEYDTPQSKKIREAFIREFEESDSPVARKVATPKLRMVPKTRIESFDDLEEVRKGEQAMQELLDLCEEAEKVRDIELKIQDESGVAEQEPEGPLSGATTRQPGPASRKASGS